MERYVLKKMIGVKLVLVYVNRSDCNRGKFSNCYIVCV